MGRRSRERAGLRCRLFPRQSGDDAASLPGDLPGAGQQPHPWLHPAADGGGQPGEVSIGQPLVYLKAGQRIARRHAGSLLGTVVPLVADDAAATPPEMSWAALSVSAMFDRAGTRDLARVLLDEPDLRRRWAHTVAVAGAGQRVADAAGLAGRDAELLVAAAWLHDIGYSQLVTRLRVPSARWCAVPSASGCPRLLGDFGGEPHCGAY